MNLAKAWYTLSYFNVLGHITKYSIRDWLMKTRSFFEQNLGKSVRLTDWCVETALHEGEDQSDQSDLVIRDLMSAESKKLICRMKCVDCLIKICFVDAVNQRLILSTYHIKTSYSYSMKCCMLLIE